RWLWAALVAGCGGKGRTSVVEACPASGTASCERQRVRYERLRAQRTVGNCCARGRARSELRRKQEGHLVLHFCCWMFVQNQHAVGLKVVVAVKRVAGE